MADGVSHRVEFSQLSTYGRKQLFAAIRSNVFYANKAIIRRLGCFSNLLGIPMWRANGGAPNKQGRNAQGYVSARKVIMVIKSLTV